MYTASEKKRENIAEYILYMWQIEDLIRAYNLDIDRIDSEIIAQYQNLTDTQKRDLHEWYESLIDMMRREGVEKQGHKNLSTFLFILTNLFKAIPNILQFFRSYWILG